MSGRVYDQNFCSISERLILTTHFRSQMTCVTFFAYRQFYFLSSFVWIMFHFLIQVINSRTFVTLHWKKKTTAQNREKTPATIHGYWHVAISLSEPSIPQFVVGRSPTVSLPSPVWNPPVPLSSPHFYNTTFLKVSWNEWNALCATI